MADQGDSPKEVQADLEGEWGRAFAQSRAVLERLADEALADHRAGRTTPLDPETT